ncbi:MAG: DAK2 domain-containing protein [Dehalococcoidia bacterium]|nr:MAG: DAK2 domain-containing protein [Dehalococcoidia bacterium]
MADAPTLALDATRLQRAFEVAERWLAQNREGINAINVYPVPDGDTGTNMLLTWRAALKGGVEGDGAAAGTYLGHVARGALMGARGNSGVILSQIIRGLAESCAGVHTLDTSAFARALEGASATAYAAVTNPVEGTILTVIREASAAAASAHASGEGTEGVLYIMLTEAFASVKRTPELLPRLREAGVVDSGGMGVAVILQGLVCGILDHPLPAEPLVTGTAEVKADAVEHEGHGFCTEFVISGTGLDRSTIEGELAAAGGSSILVVGDPSMLRVHVHVERPEHAFDVGERHGTLAARKAEDMQAQHEAWMDDRDDEDLDPSLLPAIGLVAVAEGRGIAAAFRDLGAGRVLLGQAGVKVSAGDILEAARRAGREHAIVLPNDKDVLMAANQAAAASDGFLTVVPSRSPASGLTAALEYRGEGDAGEVAAAMSEVMAGVRAVEVSRSVRTATVDGVAVREGDAIALVDGRMVAATETLEDALLAGLDVATEDGAEIATIYLGQEAPADAAERLPRLIGERHPDLEIQIMPGGQPYYPYLAGVE